MWLKFSVWLISFELVLYIAWMSPNFDSVNCYYNNLLNHNSAIMNVEVPKSNVVGVKVTGYE